MEQMNKKGLICNAGLRLLGLMLAVLFCASCSVDDAESESYAEPNANSPEGLSGRFWGNWDSADYSNDKLVFLGSDSIKMSAPTLASSMTVTGDQIAISQLPTAIWVGEQVAHEPYVMTIQPLGYGYSADNLMLLYVLRAPDFEFQYTKYGIQHAVRVTFFESQLFYNSYQDLAILWLNIKQVWRDGLLWFDNGEEGYTLTLQGTRRH